MGIGLVGDQKAVIEEIGQLRRAAIRVMRDQVVWTVRVGTPLCPAISCVLLRR